MLSRVKGKGFSKRNDRNDPIWVFDLSNDPLGKVVEELKEIRDHISSEREVTWKVCELMSNVSSSDLYERIENLLQDKSVKKLEDQVDDLIG